MYKTAKMNANDLAFDASMKLGEIYGIRCDESITLSDAFYIIKDTQVAQKAIQRLLNLTAKKD